MRILLLIMVCCTTGCFAAQYDRINNQADRDTRALDAQCKENMTDWCRIQYDLVQRNRENDLSDLQVRRQIFVNSMNRNNRR